MPCLLARNEHVCTTLMLNHKVHMSAFNQYPTKHTSFNYAFIQPPRILYIFHFTRRPTPHWKLVASFMCRTRIAGRTYNDFIDRGHNAYTHTNIQIAHRGLLSSQQKHKMRQYVSICSLRTCWPCCEHPPRCHRARAYKSDSNYAVFVCAFLCPSIRIFGQYDIFECARDCVNIPATMPITLKAPRRIKGNGHKAAATTHANPPTERATRMRDLYECLRAFQQSINLFDGRHLKLSHHHQNVCARLFRYRRDKTAEA